MNNWKIIIVALFLLVPLVQASVDISVKTAYTSPYPVEPGDTVVLGIEVANNGEDTVNNLEVTLMPKYPFTLIEEPTQKIITLNSGGIRIIEYDLFVDISAISTLYQLPVKVKFSDSNEITKNVNIRVQGRPNLGFIEIPNFTISPGDIKDMKVEIKNLGTGKAKRVVAVLEPSTEDIKTILSGGNVYVGDIEPNEIKVAIFNIYTNYNANFGVYNSFLKLIYEDESGYLFNKTFNIGILISGRPDIRIIKVDTDTTKNELSIDIINQGNSEARRIIGELLLDNAVIDVDYLSKLNAGKSASLKYNIPNTKNNSITIRLEYMGPDNGEYERIEIIKWNRISKISSWLIILVILIAVYIIIKNQVYRKILIFRKIKRK